MIYVDPGGRYTKQNGKRKWVFTLSFRTRIKKTYLTKTTHHLLPSKSQNVIKTLKELVPHHFCKYNIDTEGLLSFYPSTHLRGALFFSIEGKINNKKHTILHLVDAHANEYRNIQKNIKKHVFRALQKANYVVINGGLFLIEPKHPAPLTKVAIFGSKDIIVVYLKNPWRLVDHLPFFVHKLKKDLQRDILPQHRLLLVGDKFKEVLGAEWPKKEQVYGLKFEYKQIPNSKQFFANPSTLIFTTQAISICSKHTVHYLMPATRSRHIPSGYTPLHLYSHPGKKEAFEFLKYLLTLSNIERIYLLRKTYTHQEAKKLREIITKKINNTNKKIYIPYLKNNEENFLIF